MNLIPEQKALTENMRKISTENRAGVYTLEKREKKWVGNYFFPFCSEKGPKAPVDPFKMEQIKLEWAKIIVYKKLLSCTTFYLSRSIFFTDVNRLLTTCLFLPVAHIVGKYDGKVFEDREVSFSMREGKSK